MSYYTFEVTKRIAVTVESESEEMARDCVLNDIADGEYSYSFDKAGAELKLLDKEER